jgi:hypothetical protein
MPKDDWGYIGHMLDMPDHLRDAGWSGEGRKRDWKRYHLSSPLLATQS